MRPKRILAPGRGDRLLPLAVVTLSAMVLFLPAWGLYLSMILPKEHVTRDWDLVWGGFDLGLALLTAVALYALWRRAAWVTVVVGALAAAFMCDAWFDVMTSHGGERLVAIGLALVAELPVALVAILVGVRIARDGSTRAS